VLACPHGFQSVLKPGGQQGSLAWTTAEIVDADCCGTAVCLRPRRSPRRGRGGLCSRSLTLDVSPVGEFTPQFRRVLGVSDGGPVATIHDYRFRTFSLPFCSPTTITDRHICPTLA